MIAQGRLSFESVSGQTAVRAAYAESPLRLLTPRRRDGAAWVYAATLGGGFVDGDRLRMEIDVAAGCRAFVSTQGPTRVYRSPRGCESDLVARVAEGAALLLLPDPAACFAGARYKQRSEIALAKGASLAFWEVFSAGRDGWTLSRMQSAIALRCEGSTVIEETLLLDPAHGSLPQRMGRFQALATLVLAGPLFARARAAARERIDAQPLAPRARLVEAASALREDVLAVRLAGESLEELQRALRSHLGDLRPLLGDDPFARRF